MLDWVKILMHLKWLDGKKSYFYCQHHFQIPHQPKLLTMKNTRIMKKSFRLALYGGLFVVSAAMLSACGETETTTETTDTVVTEPAPVVIDTAVIDTGRHIMDPKKPEGESQ
jgi:hypothetical protein